MSSFNTLNIATQALLAHRNVIDVISNNVANVNTPGYVRRVTHLASHEWRDGATSFLGGGVSVQAIELKRARFLFGRYLGEQSALADSDVRSTFLARVEEATGEPGERGVGAALDAFFASWTALGNDHAEPLAKADVVGRAQTLASTIRGLSRRLAEERATADRELGIVAEQANGLLADVAALNERIHAAEVNGAEAADLRNQRSIVLEQLAEIVSFQSAEGENGMVSVSINGRSMVADTTHRTFELTATTADGVVTHRLGVSGSSETMTVTGGRLGSLVALRDDTIAGYETRLDALANGLIAEVNALHSQGASGADFFTGSGAMDIAVNAVLVSDHSQVATSFAGSSGHDLARAMAALKEASVSSLGGQSFGGYYRDLVLRMGTDAAQARFSLEASAAAFAQVRAQREQIEAVSLDEEMSNMLAAEHAYEAAARMVATASDMLDTLLQLR